MTTTPLTAPLVDAFATGFLRTAIHRLPAGGYLWVRRPGADRPTPLTGPTPGARAALDSLPPLSSPGVCLALPTTESDALHYPAPGADSVAKLLWTDLTPAATAHLAAALHGTGRLLRALHTAPGGTAETDRTGPGGPARLASWMDSGTGPRCARQLHGVLRDRLGDARWKTVRAWCHALTEPSPGGGTLLHGAPSTGGLVPSPAGTDAALFTGEDITRGPAGFDLGWLLGEFLELRMTTAARALHRPVLTDLPAALLDGYGAGADPGTTGRAAVLRIMTHAHDFAAYVGWHAELDLYATTLPRYVDTEGHAALDGTA
ncbi:hypothetical protein [Streptomyces mirabilis]|uniref:hypothetical protein n=1 Tax=Streptomyces mirabilis TaxID=68239 RepID=UPI0036B00F48